MSPAYDDAVLAWAAHLRSGGTTPWGSFRPDGGPLYAGPVPGAAQLELVRRLAARWSGPGFEPLADRVLLRDGPGRGMAKTLPLTHPSAPGGLGAPPIDPADVPVDELLRIGVGLLADLAVTLPQLAAPPVPRERRRREVVIWAPTFDELLTGVWRTKTMAGAAMPWRRFVRNWAARDALPFLADPSRLAARAARRVGPSRVHVHVGAAAPDASPVGLSVEGIELLRRVNPVLGIRVTGPELDGVRRALAGALSGDGTPTLRVPSAHRVWARHQVERVTEAIAAGGYSVHGDLAEFAAGVKAPRHPRPEAVLDHLLDVVVRSEEQR